MDTMEKWPGHKMIYEFSQPILINGLIAGWYLLVWERNDCWLIKLAILFYILGKNMLRFV